MPRTGTGRVYQRGNVWWIQYGFRGDDIRESSGSPRISEARKLLKRRIGEIGRGRLIGPAEEKLGFEDLAEMIRNDYQAQGFASARRLELSLRHLSDFFGLSRALDITDDRVTAYKVARSSAGASASSIQKEVAALKRALRLANKAGKLSNVPDISGVTVGDANARTGFFTAVAIEKVIAELPPHLRPVVRFGYLTGWRKTEILGLQWSAIDLQAGTITLPASQTKNRKPRQTPFSELPELKSLVEEQRKHTREEERRTDRIISSVFHHRGGLPIRSMDGAWRSACKRAGLGGWLFHDLRRTAVRNLERAGVSRSVAQSFTGHRTDSVYSRYAITDSAAQREGMRKYARLHASEQTEPRKVVPIHEVRR